MALCVSTTTSKSVTYVFALVALCLSATGCAASAPMNIHIGYEAISPDYSFFIVQEKGYFRDEGLIVEATEFKNTNDQMLALLSGKVDMVPNASLELLLAAENESPGRFQVFMANGDIGNMLMVRADSDIASVDQLAGRRIGTFPGTTVIAYSQLALAQYFKQSSMPEFVAMDPASLIGALTTGQVSAIVAIEPLGTIAVKTGAGKVILNNPLGNVITPFYGGASLLNSGYVKNKPQAAAAVVRAMNRAVDFIKANPNEAITILAKYTNFPPELVSGANIGSIWKLEEIDRDSVDRLADIMIAARIVSKRVDTSHWYYKP
jgi:ABC-type nitrate/sulfonate/bicarbonate transport system substrate-binding protein